MPTSHPSHATRAPPFHYVIPSRSFAGFAAEWSDSSYLVNAKDYPMYDYSRVKNSTHPLKKPSPVPFKHFKPNERRD